MIEVEVLDTYQEAVYYTVRDGKEDKQVRVPRRPVRTFAWRSERAIAKTKAQLKRRKELYAATDSIAAQFKEPK